MLAKYSLMENNIAHYRKLRGWSQEQFARVLGTSRQQLSEWERGLKLPRVDAAIEIARVLGCSVEDIFTRT